MYFFCDGSLFCAKIRLFRTPGSELVNCTKMWNAITNAFHGGIRLAENHFLARVSKALIAGLTEFWWWALLGGQRPKTNTTTEILLAAIPTTAKVFAKNVSIKQEQKFSTFVHQTGDSVHGEGGSGDEEGAAVLWRVDRGRVQRPDLHLWLRPRALCRTQHLWLHRHRLQQSAPGRTLRHTWVLIIHSFAFRTKVKFYPVANDKPELFS